VETILDVEGKPIPEGMHIVDFLEKILHFKLERWQKDTLVIWSKQRREAETEKRRKAYEAGLENGRREWRYTNPNFFRGFESYRPEAAPAPERQCLCPHEKRRGVHISARYGMTCLDCGGKVPEPERPRYSFEVIAVDEAWKFAAPQAFGVDWAPGKDWTAWFTPGAGPDPRPPAKSITERLAAIESTLAPGLVSSMLNRIELLEGTAIGHGRRLETLEGEAKQFQHDVADGMRDLEKRAAALERAIPRPAHEAPEWLVTIVDRLTGLESKVGK
jgi:hypothetical protein